VQVVGPRGLHVCWFPQADHVISLTITDEGCSFVVVICGSSVHKLNPVPYICSLGPHIYSGLWLCSLVRANDTGKYTLWSGNRPNQTSPRLARPSSTFNFVISSFSPSFSSLNRGISRRHLSNTFFTFSCTGIGFRFCPRPRCLLLQQHLSSRLTTLPAAPRLTSVNYGRTVQKVTTDTTSGVVSVVEVRPSSFSHSLHLGNREPNSQYSSGKARTDNSQRILSTSRLVFTDFFRKRRRIG